MRKIIFLVAIALAGCVSKQAMFVNPKTNQTQTCYAKGWGWIGAPMANSAFNNCEEQLRAQGYRYPGEPETPLEDEEEDD